MALLYLLNGILLMWILDEWEKESAAKQAARRTERSVRERIQNARTYEISFDFVKYRGFIKCLRCGLKSYNSNDIANLYCGNCHEFHDPLAEGKETTAGGG